MHNSKTEEILMSIVEILKHIEHVQKDVMDLSEHSSSQFCTFMETNGTPADAKMLEAFQNQDIIAQQLSAVSEAVTAIEKNIGVYLHAVRQDQNILSESMDKLAQRLARSLKTAKEKQEAFSGNAFGTRRADEIEFF